MIPRLLDGVTWLVDDASVADIPRFLAEHPVPEGTRVISQHLERQHVHRALVDRNAIACPLRSPLVDKARSAAADLNRRRARSVEGTARAPRDEFVAEEYRRRNSPELVSTVGSSMTRCGSTLMCGSSPKNGECSRARSRRLRAAPRVGTRRSAAPGWMDRTSRARCARLPQAARTIGRTRVGAIEQIDRTADAVAFVARGVLAAPPR